MNVLAVRNQPTLQDFGHDVWWIVLIKIVGVFVLLVLMTLFAIVLERKGYDPTDVAAGRAYVEAYVSFFKYAEGEDHGHGDHSPALAHAGHAH